VIISPDGYVATNNHVIESGSDISIRLDDQREFKAVVIGRDQHTDLALLKIEGKNLPFIQFGNSDSLQVGEWVLAIGNPFRLHSTVTAGIVSAKGRSIHIMRDASGIESFIQTDAAVNPGNSGGALVNTKGDLVGINTAIITYSGQYEGFSFAVPANLARKVLNDLRDFGKVQRGWMGISIRQVDAQMAINLKLKRVGGVYIDEVVENSAAEASGLRPGDVIMEINGLETKTTPQFMEQVARMRPGDKLEIEYSRNGNLRITTVVLSDDRVVRTSFVAGDEILSQLGIELRDLSPSEIARLGKPGVFVEKIYRGSKIDRVNMEEGYIITRLNGKPVNDLDAFLGVLQNTEGLVVLDGFYEDYPGKFPYTFELD
jgi:Do/DeqQ family serine protease